MYIVQTYTHIWEICPKTIFFPKILLAINQALEEIYNLISTQYTSYSLFGKHMNFNFLFRCNNTESHCTGDFFMSHVLPFMILQSPSTK